MRRAALCLVFGITSLGCLSGCSSKSDSTALIPSGPPADLRPKGFPSQDSPAAAAPSASNAETGSPAASETPVAAKPNPGRGAGGGGGGFNPAAIFDQADKNGDGMITTDELAGNPMAAQASQADTDGDGAISKEEFQQAVSVMMAQRGGGGPGGPTSGNAAGESGQDGQPEISDADKSSTTTTSGTFGARRKPGPPEELASINERIANGLKSFQEQKYMKSGDQIRSAQRTLEWLAASGDPDVIKHLRDAYEKVKEAHEMLTAKHIPMDQLKPLPTP